MKDEEEDIELIEAFLRGALDGEVLSAFQKRRHDDADFDRKVTDYTQIINQIKTSQEKDFLNKVKRWDSEIENRAKGKVIPLGRILSIAASVLVVAVAGVFVFRNNSNNDELFQENFHPFEDVISERSARNDHQQKGMALYAQKDYDAAIPQLDSAVMEDPANTSLKCYLGIAYLADGRSQQAKTIFEKMVNGERSLFTEVAEWNLALTYLKLGDEAAVKRVLEGISQQKDHHFYEEASDLLKKL